MPTVKNVGEPCAGEPHARIDAAARGNQTSRARTCRAVQAPLADPTTPTPHLDENEASRTGRGRTSPGLLPFVRGESLRCTDHALSGTRIAGEQH